MSQGTLAAGCGVVNGVRARRAGARRLTDREKVRIGFALLALQLLLLAVTFGFREDCDRRLERDGISIAEMLSR